MFINPELIAFDSINLVSDFHTTINRHINEIEIYLRSAAFHEGFQHTLHRAVEKKLKKQCHSMENKPLKHWC